MIVFFPAAGKFKVRGKVVKSSLGRALEKVAKVFEIIMRSIIVGRSTQ